MNSNTHEMYKYGQYLIKLIPNHIDEVVIVNNELVLHSNPNKIVELLLFLRDHSNAQFKSIIDICGVDFPERTKRFEVVYHLLSILHNFRVRIKVFVDETTPVPSCTSVFKGANWYEREAWDLYGVFFSNHPDLRRILTDYGFQGFPMRKDFPLTGYLEVRYDDEQKRVVYEPLEVTQEFRNFEFTSPWEQTQ